jgi:hypothetical protein
VIVASLLLIVAAAVLLVVGLVRDANLLLILSIAVSLLAAVALYVGARQARATDDDAEESADDTDRPEEASAAPSEDAGQRRTMSLLTDLADTTALRGSGDRTTVGNAAAGTGGAAGRGRRPDWPLERPGAAEATDTVVAGPPVGRDADLRLDRLAETREETVADIDDGAPAGEPPRQRTPRADAELIARLPAEVLVVDGRPRYHVTGCPHLLDRESEPLAVSEAVELGFTPCGWCQPDTVLLGGTPEV